MINLGVQNLEIKHGGTKIGKKYIFGRNSRTKTRDAKIPQNFDLVELQNFYRNVTSFFLTQFILKLLIKIFH